MVIGSQFGRRAFTLVELLLVLAILGIVSAVVVPMTARSLRGNQRRMAIRSVVGAAKYARSMAVLHQCPMELRLPAGEGGLLVVDAAGHWEADTNEVPAEAGLLVEAESARGPMYGGAAGGFGPKEPPPVPDMEVRLERNLGKIRLVEWAIGDGPMQPAEGRSRLHFDTNGRCTPFVVVLEDPGGERVRVAIDHLGGASTAVDP
jgi:prepilin-type N-terminal cleavage/methylation domain-containing protein